MNNKLTELNRNLAQSVARDGVKPSGFLVVGLALVTFGLATTAQDASDIAPAKSPAIPWSQIGAKAGADYKGDGLSVAPTAEGARLRCVFQRLEGEATQEGLWLTSTVTNGLKDRFRIVAATVHRQSSSSSFSSSSSSTLQKTGIVSLEDQKVRFIRPGITEEYGVSMDGVRQDFLVRERPEGVGELVVNLAVSGAKIEPASGGARLVLESSGRKITYSRLHATDASGKELPARMEVASHTTLAVVVNDSEAVYPLRIDPTFSDANWISMGGLPGADGIVYAAALDASGNLYIGGFFTVVGDVLATNVAKWNGSSWSPLGSGLGNNDPNARDGVYALAVSGSDLYAGGSFTNAGGIAANYVAKWNGNSWSALGSAIGGATPGYPSVSALVVSGTDLYAGGRFTRAGGSAANNIAKWNGANWSALGSGMDYTVLALAVSGSELYAGGYFTTAGGIPANRIAKWNGSSWSALGAGISSGRSSYIAALAVSGSDVYAGGDFTTGDPAPGNYIAKWNGSSWSALGSGMDWTVHALAVSGSNVYAGGEFHYAGGVYIGYGIAKWNGSSWGALGSGMEGSGSTAVYALAVSSSNLYAGGNFSKADGSAASNIAKWNGSTWSALGSGLDNTVYALAVSGSDLYVGGQFHHAGGVDIGYGIAKWNGSSWSALGSGVNGAVEALAVSGSNVYAGGAFNTAGGGPGNCIAKWDGNTWSALGSGLDQTVYALAISGSDLYAGGFFTTAVGSPGNYIAKWDGTSWSALGSGLDEAVYALAVSGSDLYAAGTFTTAGGIAATNIAKWDGTGWSALGSGLRGAGPLAVSGTDLYVGGGFTNAGGIPANNIAKWNGSSWSALGSGINGGVAALAVSGGDLYAASGPTASGITVSKWNGSSWSALGSGLQSAPGAPCGVYALAVSGSDLYAGGRFTMAGGKVSAYLAKAILYPPVLGIEPDGFGGYFITFTGSPGDTYRLQRAPTVTGPWSTSASQTAPASGLLEFWDLFPPPGQGFYRTMQP